jgi:hypothetical protein
MTKNIGGLSSVEILALSSLKAGESRDAVLPGSHPVDFTVRVQGTIKVGEDSEKAPTARLPHLAVMALFIQRMGFQRDAATAILFECMQEAISMDKDSRETLLTNFPGIAECEEGLRAMMASLPPIRERGHVTAKLAITAA